MAGLKLEHPITLEKLKVKSVEHKGCWEWIGTISDSGYGDIRIRVDFGKYKLIKVHRLAYELTKGEIPYKYEIDHLCKNRLCFNPDHLEAVTKYENNKRSDSLSALNLRKTHCIRGHYLNPSNTYIPPKKPNSRYCRTCMKVRKQSIKVQLQEAYA